MDFLRPLDYQIDSHSEDFIVQTERETGREIGRSEEEKIELDVLFVGAGPASLSSAIRLADLAKHRDISLQIGVVEKASRLGGHSLSGAVVHPMVFNWLFPEKSEGEMPFRKKADKGSFYFLSGKRAYPLPLPPGMKNKGCYTASLCELTRFLGKEAQQRDVHIFTSTPAEKLLMEGEKAVGVLSKAYGLNRDGSRESPAEPRFKILAKVIVLGEGVRGHLSQAWLNREKISSQYPQTYALGVKEVWKVKEEPDRTLHSIGWPLPKSVFGGSWLYPLGKGMISLGIVVGLDSPLSGLSAHQELNKLKSHPLFKKILEGGERLEWGAKILPEGGWLALPQRLSGAQLLLLGDSAGMINMASLKGIHYAMASGWYSAEVIVKAFEKGDFSYDILKEYDQKIQTSFIKKDLYFYRNLRQGFRRGLYQGLLRAGLIIASRGHLPRDFKAGQLPPDHQVKKYVSPLTEDDKKADLKDRQSKAEAVYLSGNRTRDQIPSHLKASKNTPEEVGRFYEKMCPAGVYEWEGKLKTHAPNCVDCKATDVLGPGWSPRERGSGPDYRWM